MNDLTPLSYQQVDLLLNVVRKEINRNIEKCIQSEEKEVYFNLNKELTKIKDYLITTSGVFLSGVKF